MPKHRPTFPAVVHLLLQRDALEFGSQPELLLIRRAGSGFMDGVYSLPGGHVEPGEMPLMAAHRECAEEVGVTPVGLVPVCVLPYLSGSAATGQHQGFNFVFAASRWEGQPRLAEPEGADLFCWQNPAYLPERCVPWLAQVLAAQQGGPWYHELSYS